MRHSTKECWTLRGIFNRKISNVELQITTRPDLKIAPYPAHERGMEVNVVFHVVDKGEIAKGKDVTSTSMQTASNHAISPTGVTPQEDT